MSKMKLLGLQEEPTSEYSINTPDYGTPLSNISSEIMSSAKGSPGRERRDIVTSPGRERLDSVASTGRERLDSVASADHHPFDEYTQSVDTTLKQTGFGENTVLELPDLTVFKAVMITYWDNILGPQVHKCWIRSREESDDKFINYVNMHVLTGEMDETSYSSRDREKKLLFIPEQQIIVLGIIFNVSSKISRTVKLYCLSLVFPLLNSRQASRITNLYSFLYKSCTGIKESIKESTMGSRRSDDYIGEMIERLDATTNDLLQYSMDQVSYPLQYFGDGASLERLEFLKKVYQAVFQCAGFSLIIGTRKDTLMMEQMSLLISYIIPATEKCVTICPIERHTEFTNHIFLQTLMYEDDPEAIFDYNDVKFESNRFPLAVIDVSRHSIKVTASLEAFTTKQAYKDPKGLHIERYGNFVDKIVMRMAPFRKNPEFLTRLGALALTELTCKAELFLKLFMEVCNVNTVKRMLKWESCDCDIFIAWACRKEPDLKKRLFTRDISSEQLELSQVIGGFGRSLSR